MLQWKEYFYLNLGYHFRYFKFSSSGCVVFWDSQKCPGSFEHCRNSAKWFFSRSWVCLKERCSVSLLEAAALSTGLTPELVFYLFTVDQEKCTYCFPSPFYSSLIANWWLQKLLPGVFFFVFIFVFWLSNTCLSLFRCYKFHQIVFAWLEVWAN